MANSRLAHHPPANAPGHFDIIPFNGFNGAPKTLSIRMFRPALTLASAFASLLTFPIAGFTQTVFDDGAVNNVTSSLSEVVVTNATTVNILTGGEASPPDGSGGIVPNAIEVNGNSIIVVDGGSINGTNNTSAGNSRAGDGIEGGPASITVNSGLVAGGDRTAGVGFAGDGMELFGGAVSVIVNGGAVRGGNALAANGGAGGDGIEVNSGSVLINGGTVSGGDVAQGGATNGTGGNGLQVLFDASVTITAGDLIGGLNTDGTRQSSLATSGDGGVDISGGTFTGGGDSSIGVNANVVIFGGSATIRGGTFITAPGAPAAEFAGSRAVVSGGSFPSGAIWRLVEGANVIVDGEDIVVTENENGDGGTITGTLADSSPLDIVYSIDERSSIGDGQSVPPAGIPVNQFSWLLILLLAALGRAAHSAIRA